MSLIPEPPQYYTEPFCDIFFERKGGGGKAANPFFEDTKEIIDINSCIVTLDSKKLDTASINFTAFPETVDLAMQGVHEGTKVWVKMGYRDKILPIPPAPVSRIIFVGQLDRPNVSHEADGNISISARAKSLAQNMNVEKKTRSFKKMPRVAILSQIFLPYLKYFPTTVILFKEMTKFENNLKQIRKTDFQFILELARRWGCIFHQTIVGDKMGLIFTDSDYTGRKLIDSNEKSIFGINLHWRRGKSNLVSVNFSGNTGGKKGPKVSEPDKTGKLGLPKIVTIPDGDDAGTWELDETKVAAYTKKFGITAALKLNAKSFQERRDFFYTKRINSNPSAPDSSQREGKSPVLQGQGILGHKAEFEMSQGDVNVVPNMNVYFGGDVMSRFKSSYASKLEKVPTGKSWQILKVIHKWDQNGYNTAGTAGK